MSVLSKFQNCTKVYIPTYPYFLIEPTTRKYFHNLVVIHLGNPENNKCPIKCIYTRTWQYFVFFSLLARQALISYAVRSSDNRAETVLYLLSRSSAPIRSVRGVIRDEFLIIIIKKYLIMKTTLTGAGNVARASFVLHIRDTYHNVPLNYMSYSLKALWIYNIIVIIVIKILQLDILYNIIYYILGNCRYI